MKEKDTTEKILEEYNDVFADIINVIVFGGEQRVKPESLTNLPVHSQYKADDARLHEQERDVSKYWKESNIEFAIWGLENQTRVDKYMPLRIIGYDGASYRSQLLSKRKKPMPVITLVLYFGTEEEWNQPTSLKDVLEIPEGLEAYVNDYRIHVVNVAWLSQEVIGKFQSDFRIVANFFAERRKNSDYMPRDKRTITHVDEVLKLLSVMTGDYRYQDVLLDEKGKEVKTMCDVIDRLENKGRLEGEQRLGRLICELLNAGRTEDAKKAASDEEARKKFYREFGIID